MKSYLLILLAALPLFTQQAGASLRQTTNPAQRALEAQQQRRIAEQERRESQRPGIPLVTPSPNQVIGKVARVNSGQGFVVGWLHSRYLNLSGTIITRDDHLRTTAVLAVSHARSNRAAGLRIVSGVPNVGDEIVITSLPQQGGADATQAGDPQQPQTGNAPWRAVPRQPRTQAQHAADAHPQQQRTQQTRPAQQAQAAQEQQMLIPAHRMRNMSNAKPEVETRITVTVE